MFFELFSSLNVIFMVTRVLCLTELRPKFLYSRFNRLMKELERKTLSGGSLGSCVDEERSQLCELM